MSVEATPVTGGDAVGRYADQTAVENVFGVNNVTTYSNLQGDTVDADTNRIQAGLDYACGWIDSFFHDSPYLTPLAFTDAISPIVVRDWAAKIAGIWLYDSRGLSRDDGAGTKMTAMEASVKDEMSLYKGGIRRLCAARRWPSPSAPVGGTAMGN